MTKLVSCSRICAGSAVLAIVTLALVPMGGCEDSDDERDGTALGNATAGTKKDDPAAAGPDSPPSTPNAGLCTPGDWQACYYGPPGTQGVGICQGGYQECSGDGTEWYECDDVRPSVESCTTAEDDDCDGQANEGCLCLPWEKESCCVGENNVVCEPGVRPCAPDGLSWGACIPVSLSCAEPAGPPGTHNFSWGYGSGNLVSGGSVVADGDCNVYFTGSFDGTVDLGAGPVTSLVSLGWSDAFLAKLNSNGEHVWSKYFQHSTGRRNAAALAMDGAGNIIAVGSYIGSIDLGSGLFTSAASKNDIYLGKFDSSGNLLWARSIGGIGNDFSSSVATDPSGNILVSGQFESTVDFGAGPMVSAGGRDGFILKLDPNGNTLWSRAYGNAGTNSVGKLVVDAAGNATAFGAFTGTLTIGSTTLVSAGKEDMVALKIDPNGNVIWAKRFGGTEADQAGSSAIDSQGNVITIGRFRGTMNLGGSPLVSAGGDDLFLFKMDANGNHLWSARYGDAGYQGSGSVAVDSADQVLFGGVWAGTLDFGAGPVAGGTFLVKLSSSGSLVSARRYGAGAGFDIAVHPSGNVVLSGGYNALVDFGGGSLPPTVQQRGFIASVSP